MSRITVDLHGKVALITGGGSGIGRGFALQMARRGASVTVVDLNGTGAAAVAEEIKALGIQSLDYQVDVRDQQAIQAATSETISHFGHLDFIFANAGVLGLITASYNGIKAGAHVIPYRVTKAAAIMYMRCMALVLAPYDVTVNAICPGVTLTPMQVDYATRTATERGITTKEYLDERTSLIPMHHLTEIEDLTGLAEFLVSDSARLITGQAIAADGGVMIS